MGDAGTRETPAPPAAGAIGTATPSSFAFADRASYHRAFVALHARMLADLGHPLRPGAAVLDLGCGDGDLVSAYRGAGFEALGADLDPGPIAASPVREHLRPIAAEGAYRLPFDDGSFDFVASDQVLEHVRDYRATLAEVHRVLAPGGASLHTFPARWRPVECHVHVPLGGVLRGPRWLTLWALLGVRNAFQKGLGFREVVARNRRFLGECTNYLGRREILEPVRAVFGPAGGRFVEDVYLKHWFGRARHAYPLVRRLRFLAALFSALHTRVLFLEKPAPAARSGV